MRIWYQKSTPRDLHGQPSKKLTSTSELRSSDTNAMKTLPLRRLPNTKFSPSDQFLPSVNLSQ